MAIAFQSAGVSPGASSNTCVITKPTGTAVGDLLIAACSFDDGGASSVTLSGWTLLKKTQTGTLTVASLWKIADSGDVSASDFTFTSDGTSGSNIGGMLRITGAATTSMFGTVVDSVASGTSRASNASANVITSTNDIFIVIGGSRDDDNWSVADFTTTQNGSTEDGYTATERVDANTLSGNDTSIAMDTVTWDGTGDGSTFANINRTGSVATMALQCVLLKAPQNVATSLTVASVSVTLGALAQVIVQGISTALIPVVTSTLTAVSTVAKWTNLSKNAVAMSNTTKNTSTFANTSKNASSFTNVSKT